MLTTDPAKDDPVTDTSIASRPARRGDARVARAVLVAHGASLLAAFAVLWWVDHTQWFFGDDWDFIVDRGLSHAVFGLWTPHNEHWSTLPILLYRAFFSVVGVRTYAPYILALIVAHLLLTHLLWRVMIRVGVEPWIATALAAVFAILGAGSENLLWAFQIGFVGSVLFGYVAVLLLDNPGSSRRRDGLASAALLAGLMCSGIGVTMVAVAGAYVLLRHGWDSWRRALVVVAGPTAIFLVWFALVGHNGLAGDHAQVSTLLDVPAYLWSGLANAFERTAGIPGAGPALLVLLAGWLIARAGRSLGDVAPAVALALGVIPMFFIIALGRSNLGVAVASSIRYAYLSMLLLLPAVGLALTHLAGSRLAGRLGVIGVLGIVAVSNVSLLRADADARVARDDPVERQILAAADLVASGQRVIARLPEPRYSPNITADSLLVLRRHGQLPHLALTAADRTAAASQLQVAVTGSPLASAPFPNPLVTGASTSGQAGCVVAQPNLPLAYLVLRTPPDGGAVQLTSSADGEVGIVLQLPDGPPGPRRTAHFSAGQPVYLSVTAADAAVTVSLPAAGSLQLCGLGQ